MSLLLAAIGATMAALLELSLVQYITVGGAHPHLVLVLAVIVTVAVGFEPGLVWAFVGGVALDVIADRPLGVSALALLISVGGAAALARALVRLRPLAPIIIVGIFSLVNSLIQLGLFGALKISSSVSDPIGVLAPGIAYDLVLAALIGPLAVAVHDRRLNQDRVDW